MNNISQSKVRGRRATARHSEFHEAGHPADAAATARLAGSLSQGSPRWVALVARVAGPSLDERLAEGASPESSALLSARAQLVTSPAMRRALSESYLDILIQAREDRRLFDLRVPVLGERILDSEELVRQVADALRAPLVTVRGVSLARALLSDGAGPLYYAASPRGLSASLREILTRLDPLAAASPVR